MAIKLIQFLTINTDSFPKDFDKGYWLWHMLLISMYEFIDIFGLEMKQWIELTSELIPLSQLILLENVLIKSTREEAAVPGCSAGNVSESVQTEAFDRIF